jgi:hypothetical protein
MPSELVVYQRETYASHGPSFTALASDESMAKILTLLGMVFRYGKPIGLMPDNPVSDVKKPRAGKKAV